MHAARGAVVSCQEYKYSMCWIVEFNFCKFVIIVKNNTDIPVSQKKLTTNIKQLTAATAHYMYTGLFLIFSTLNDNSSTCDVTSDRRQDFYAPYLRNTKKNFWGCINFHYGMQLIHGLIKNRCVPHCKKCIVNSCFIYYSENVNIMRLFIMYQPYFDQL